MNGKRILFLFVLFSAVFSFRAEGKSKVFKWTIVTEPYRNYVYPQQTGLQYNLSYLYMTESKAMRRYLKRNFNIRASASVARILKDISTGVYFERYFECKIKYLKSSDTLQVKVIYENGDTVIEKFNGGRGTVRFNLHLTRYKNQHDFSTGQIKEGKTAKGLVTSLDVCVLTPKRERGYVMITSKLYTEAEMPGILSHIKGKDLFK